MTTLTNERKAVLDDIIGDLLGTCGVLCEVALAHGISEDELTLMDLQYIDEYIFCCSCCSWWCEVSEDVSENGGDMVCWDCVE